MAMSFAAPQAGPVASRAARAQAKGPLAAVPVPAAASAVRIASAAAPAAIGISLKAGVSGAPRFVARGAARGLLQVAQAIKDGAVLDRPLRVAVIGGGPSGACAADTLAQGGVETFLFERKMDNCKVRKRTCLILVALFVNQSADRVLTCCLGFQCQKCNCAIGMHMVAHVPRATLMVSLPSLNRTRQGLLSVSQGCRKSYFVQLVNLSAPAF
jgi:hypothetical protein